MKFDIIATSAFLAASPASLILLVDPAAAAFLVTATGIVSILIHDYGRSPEPMGPPASILPFSPPDQAPAESREAA